MYDIKKRKKIPLHGFGGAICKCLSPDANFIAAGFVRKVKVYDIKKKKIVCLYEHGDDTVLNFYALLKMTKN